MDTSVGRSQPAHRQYPANCRGVRIGGYNLNQTVARECLGKFSETVDYAGDSQLRLLSVPAAK